MDPKREAERRQRILAADTKIKAFRAEVDKARRAGIDVGDSARKAAELEAAIERVKRVYIEGK